MKILHTSDWHLGKQLYGRSRHGEHALFFKWLIGVINENEIDVLLVSGDVFDSSAPNNKSVELYYNLLTSLKDSHCQHTVIIAGNHDSPSFLNAPKELLRMFNIHIIPQVTNNLEEEIIVLSGVSKTPEIIVCAVPYLRDRDLRAMEFGETDADKNTKVINGLAEHYKKISELAQEKQALYNIPIIGMGHLYTAGGMINDDDGVRKLYVGTLGLVEHSAFPTCFAYTALGHLHIPQLVAGDEYCRYSGSPIPIGFGEAEQQKIVIQVDLKKNDFRKNVPEITKIPVPAFQKLKSIKGTRNEIAAILEKLKLKNIEVWLEIEYTGEEFLDDLEEFVTILVKDSLLQVLSLRNRPRAVSSLGATGESLEQLNEEEVFLRCMDQNKIVEPEREHLLSRYNQVLHELQEKEKE